MLSIAALAFTPSEVERLGHPAERHGVRRLDLFGSAVRDDFDPDKSHLEFVVEFAPLRRGASRGFCGTIRGLRRGV